MKVSKKEIDELGKWKTLTPDLDDFVTTSKYKNILQNDIFLNGQKNYMQQYLWTNIIENFNDN